MPGRVADVGNKLRELPAEIVGLRNLTKLHLHRNSFQTFPPELGRLMSIKEVDMSFNDIVDVPGKVIGQMRFLTTLELASNRIRYVRTPAAHTRRGASGPVPAADHRRKLGTRPPVGPCNGGGGPGRSRSSSAASRPCARSTCRTTRSSRICRHS